MSQYHKSTHSPKVLSRSWRVKRVGRLICALQETALTQSDDMAITEKTIKLLWSNAAGRCSFTDCQERLTIEQAAHAAPYTLGEMAHTETPFLRRAKRDIWVMRMRSQLKMILMEFSLKKWELMSCQGTVMSKAAQPGVQPTCPAAKVRHQF
jgi:hypothetical protein